MHDQFNIVVCASGGGGNFQAIIDARQELNINISMLITDRVCGAVARAQKNGIPHVLLRRSTGSSDLFSEFNQHLPECVDLIVLAGFMPIIPSYLCELWRGKIINTHPSLLPKYGGLGMYGVKVQEAVMRANEEYAGCTVHYVEAGVDEGRVILQKAIKVDYDETPWQLGGRIFLEENRLLVDAIRLLVKRKIHF